MSTLLLAYWIIFILVVFVWRSWIVWCQTGVIPIILSSTSDVRNFVLQGFKFVVVLVTLPVVGYAFFPQYYEFFEPFDFLSQTFVQYAGFVAMTVALVWIATAQANMKKSFRVGIDEQVRTELVTYGLFQYSRNPIFVGVMFGLIGMFLVIPNAITLLVASLAYVFIQIQIRLEEDFLLSEHGSKYQEYMDSVRRWL